MEGFLITARTLHFTAAIALTGVFAFECFVAGPAFRPSSATPATIARLRRQFVWLASVSLVLAIGSGIAWLGVVAGRMSGRPFGIAFFQQVVPVVLTRTRYGEDWLLRLGLAGILGCCLLALQRPWLARGAMSWAALVFAAAMLASLAWAGHGAATPGAPGDLHLAADILHLLAAGLWLGTLPPLELLLAEARRAHEADWALVARTAIRRYSGLAVASVTVLLAAGVVNTWFLAGTVSALVGTEYGRLLLAKIGLFIAMLMVAAVNLLRLTPRRGDPASGNRNPFWRTVARLQRNARIEAGLGFGVLAIVGALGTLPPGLHSEPGWPFPFRFEIGTLTAGSQILLAILAAAVAVCGIAAVVGAPAGRCRRMAAPAAGLVLCLGFGWMLLRPAIERAYPTSFYAPAKPYDAASVARGAAAYAANCAICHGATGHGDGPAVVTLPVRPADLTAPHIFTHTQGDQFWWVSHGTEDGVMPGFAGVMSVNARWDVINFIRARAAAVLAREIGPQVTTSTALQVPDFVFEQRDKQRTLDAVLAHGPVLLVLFAPPVPVARLVELAAARQRLAAIGLDVLAVDITPSADSRAESEAPPFLVEVSTDVTSTLALYGPPEDRGETELLLDRARNVRARWTRGGRGGLPDANTLAADAERVAGLAIAPQSHVGHAH
jgi:putative copper resistance protein D